MEDGKRQYRIDAGEELPCLQGGKAGHCLSSGRAVASPEGTVRDATLKMNA